MPLTTQEKDDIANAAYPAVEHPIVQRAMEEFAFNMRFKLEGLPLYGMLKVAQTAAIVARTQALGIDPDELRLTEDEAADVQMAVARAAMDAGVSVSVVVVELGEAPVTDQQITLDILEQMGDLVPRIAPEELEEARQQRKQDALRRATNPPRLPESGHTLRVEIRSATIEGDHIGLSLVIEGKVQRPEALATARAGVLNLKVPAKVERR